MKRPLSSTVAELLADHTKLLVNEINRHSETVEVHTKTYSLEDLRMQEDVRKLINDVTTELRLKLNGRFCSKLDFVRLPNLGDPLRGYECKFVAHTPKFTE